jgi:hypothetical protein
MEVSELSTSHPWPLYPWERTPVPMEQEGRWAPELVGMLWTRENLYSDPLFHTEIRTQVKITCVIST